MLRFGIVKILNIATCFNRHEDDVITPWLVEALKHVQSLGHEIEVLTSSHRGLKDHVVNGFMVYRFRYFFARWERLTHEETAPDRVRRNPLYLFLVAFYVFFGTLKAFRVARKGHYDIIHVHWPLPHAILGYAARWACKGKLVSTFYGISVTWVKHSLKFLKPFLRWVIRVSDAVTVISSFSAAEVATIGKGNIHVIPFGAGMPIRDFNRTPKSTQEEDQKKILFVGRLVERKGVKFLLKSMAKIRHKLNLHATLVGQGPQREPLEKLASELGISDIVAFPGFVSTAELQLLFQETDLFVLPAIVDSMGCTEGLGVVLIEAMSYSKPVVASRIGGIVDVVLDQQTGSLVTPGDSDALAGAILGILSDPQLSEEMGKKGRRRVWEHFSWEAIADRITSVYSSLL